MKIYSICGVDGSGKTTLVTQLAESSLPITTLRCPQYYESGIHQKDTLARTFEKWSDHCDLEKNPILKAMVLFLQMSLFGQMEQDQCKTHPSAKILLRERDPVLDTLVYAPLYLQVLGAHAPLIPEVWSSDHAASFHLNDIHRRLPLGFESLKFSNLREYILRFFSQPQSEMPQNCLKLFQTTPPAGVILLKLDESLLKVRLEMKQKSKGGTKEHHEESGLLLKLQAGLEILAKQLSGPFQFNVKMIDVSVTNQDKVSSELLAFIQSQL